jgi:hypothetical protein
MSKMAELDMQIRDLLDEGVLPTNIANILKCPLQMVYDVIQYDTEQPDWEDYDDSMDGDHDSAMTSAGFGTDEDYGYYGDE